MHNFISSGFVTLGRGHLKGKNQSLIIVFFPLRGRIIISLTELLLSCCHSPSAKKSNNVTATVVSAQWKLDIARCHFKPLCIVKSTHTFIIYD